MRLTMIQAIASLFVASTALAGPTDHILSFRMPFGGGGADSPEDRAQVDIMHIRDALQKIQSNQTTGEVVVDPREMEAEPPGSTHTTTVNMDDPNLSGRVANYNVQFPVDKNLRPVDASTLFGNQKIRPTGTTPSSSTDNFHLPAYNVPSRAARVRADQ